MANSLGPQASELLVYLGLGFRVFVKIMVPVFGVHIKGDLDVDVDIDTDL